MCVLEGSRREPTVGSRGPMWVLFSGKPENPAAAAAKCPRCPGTAPEPRFQSPAAPAVFKLDSIANEARGASLGLRALPPEINFDLVEQLPGWSSWRSRNPCGAVCRGCQGCCGAEQPLGRVRGHLGPKRDQAVRCDTMITPMTPVWL